MSERVCAQCGATMRQRHDRRWVCPDEREHDPYAEQEWAEHERDTLHLWRNR